MDYSKIPIKELQEVHMPQASEHAEKLRLWVLKVEEEERHKPRREWWEVHPFNGRLCKHIDSRTEREREAHGIWSQAVAVVSEIQYYIDLPYKQKLQEAERMMREAQWHNDRLEEQRYMHRVEKREKGKLYYQQYKEMVPKLCAERLNKNVAGIITSYLFKTI